MFRHSTCLKPENTVFCINPKNSEGKIQGCLTCIGTFSSPNIFGEETEKEENDERERQRKTINKNRKGPRN